jgi:dTMP kinase
VSAPAPGRLVALEGVDGCGKSTQARRLAGALGALCTREPGGTPLGTALRALLLDPAGAHPVPRAEALLMAADRAQHIDEVLRPALASGRWVVTDRYSGSTLAYQGAGQRLGLRELRRVVAFAQGGLEADLNVLLDIEPEVARRRLSGLDRLERLDRRFFDRVRRGYLRLAAADPDRWAVVDGDGDEDEVAAAVRDAVTARLGAPPGGAGSR